MAATQVDKINGVWMIICGWYALCRNPTDRATDHPTLGPIPICERCATKHDLPRDIEIEVRED